MKLFQEIPFWNVKLVKEANKEGYTSVNTVRSPEDGIRAFKEIFNIEEMTKEHFLMLSLDTKHQIRGAHVVHIGSVNASIVHPRDVFQLALLNNATSIIVGHNHPSGDPTPSKEDIEVTKRLIEAGEMIGVPLLDHVIIGDTDISLRGTNSKLNFK